MSEKAPNQASSKEDLDQLSALEESMAPFGMGDLDSEHGVILKDWTAQDFANIYVRFRPHLISHARKFLRDETQAEEVVQDAFLYLMTALPELDSELGVLRFLKWKTKMLCLDIIRSSQAGLNNNLVSLPDDVADETQPLDSLERADDAAIIRLALAKLNPRHREVLISTIYEEKSQEEVALKMGIEQNALRQLIFRARRSFRQALVGEAEVRGRSISEVLVIAHSRLGASVTSILLLSILAPFLFFGLSGEVGNEDVMEPLAQQLGTPSDRPRLLENPIVAADDFGISGDSKDVNESGFAGEEKQANLKTTPHELPGTRVLSDPGSTELGIVETQPASEIESAGTIELGETLLASFGYSSMEQIAVEHQSLKITPEASKDETIHLVSDNGFSLALGIDQNSSTPVQYLWMSIESSDRTLAIVPRQIDMLTSNKSPDGLREYEILAADLVVGDATGQFGRAVVDDTFVGRNAIRIQLKFNGEQLVFQDVKFSNKT